MSEERSARRWAVFEEAADLPPSEQEKALDALNHGRLDTFVKAMHPDALSEFRTTILETLDAATKRGKEAQLLEAAARYLDWLVPGQGGALTGELTRFVEHREVLGWVLLGTMVFFSSLAFTVLVVVILVVGTLWIMTHLNHNMMAMPAVMN